MTRPQKAIVIGGGVIGVTTLYELASRGVVASLFEAREAPACETSFANGGLLTDSMSDPWNSPGVGKVLLASLFNPYSAMKLRPRAIPGLLGWGLRFLRNATPARHRAATLASYRLAATSVWRTRELHATLNLRFDYSSLGTMKIFESAESMASSLAIANLLAPQGLRYELLNRDEAVAFEPCLDDVKDRIHGALFYPHDASGDARLFTLALAKKATELGARICTATPVQRLVMKNGRVCGVQTSAGLEEAPTVIVATGHQASCFARSAGFCLPIAPVKGYSVTFQAKEGSTLPRIPVIDDGFHAGVVPLGNRLRMVGTAEFAGLDRTPSPERIENLLRFLKRLYPSISARLGDVPHESWLGFRPMSADGLPFIGESRIRGLWFNAGHGHLGWTMAAGSAKLMVDLLLGSRTKLDPYPYRIHR